MRNAVESHFKTASNLLSEMGAMASGLEAANRSLLIFMRYILPIKTLDSSKKKM